MLTDATLVAFVATTDLQRAHAFYGDVLGLTLVDMSPYAGVYDAGGMTLRVSLVTEVTPAPFTVIGWNVKDISAEIEELTARGVGFAHYPEMDQDDLGVWTAPSGSRIAWFSDPDGNVLSLTEL
jgi:predicted enzyme related to lactoylglutathione lyase